MENIQYTPEEQISYSYDGKSLTVTGIADKSLREVVIPEKLGGHPVTVIGNGAFRLHDNLEYIRVPDTVVSVENAGFRGCTSLQSAVLSASLRAIGSMAFADCVNLRSITISNAVKRMEINSFKNCRNFNEVNVKMRETGEIRKFVISCESDEAVWRYMNAVMTAVDHSKGNMELFDSMFFNIVDENSKFCVAAHRLMNPRELTRHMRKSYRMALASMVMDFIKADRVDRLTVLGELNCINPYKIEEYIDAASRIGGGCAAYLIEFKKRHSMIGLKDYSL